MRPNSIEVGQKFGRWTTISETRIYDDRAAWLCRCDCGKERTVIVKSLMNGISKSCGCLSRQITSVKNRTHGKSRTTTHDTWCGMIQRTEDKKCRSYPNYGGRGIKICRRWRESFEAFLQDMGEKPKGKSIDRFPDNDGDYEPRNCRWATPKEQMRNTRANTHLTHNGRTATLSEWAEITGICIQTICTRLRRKWPISRVLTEPTK